MAIDLGYVPRPQFVPFHQSTKRWSVLIAHRRSGKTYALLYQLIISALYIPNGRFAYCAPFYSQAKAIAFDYLLRFTQNIRRCVNVAELYVELFNGARIRLYGAGNQGGDQIRGQFFHGIVLDEYADMPPNLFNEVIRAALVDFSGFCVFAGTPRGHNHLFDVYKSAMKYQDIWYTQLLKASESGIISEEELSAAKMQLEDSQYQQEFECNFESALVGAFYGECMADAISEGRIREVLPIANVPVCTSWDLGRSDSTCITFWQEVAGQIHIIDYYENHGQNVEHYAQLVESKPYFYEKHFLPHDARAKTLAANYSVIEQLAKAFGMRYLEVLPVHYLQDGVQAVRNIFPRIWFDAIKCDRLCEALRSYQRSYDPIKKCFHETPLHDWASHPADSLRYMAQAINLRKGNDPRPKEFDFANPPIPTFDDVIKATERAQRGHRRI